MGTKRNAVSQAGCLKRLSVEPITVSIVTVLKTVYIRGTIAISLIDNPSNTIKPRVLVATIANGFATELDIAQIDARLWMRERHDGAWAQVCRSFQYRTVIHHFAQARKE